MKKVLIVTLLLLLGIAVWGQATFIDNDYSWQDRKTREYIQQTLGAQYNFTERGGASNVVEMAKTRIPYDTGTNDVWYVRVSANGQDYAVILKVIGRNKNCQSWVFLLTGQRTNQPTTPTQIAPQEETIYIDGIGNIRYSLSNNLNEIERAIYSQTGRTVNLNNVNWRLNTSDLSPNVKALMNRHNVNYSMTINGNTVIVNRRIGNEWYIFY